MKHCPNCNTPLQDNANFCPRCGNQLSDGQPAPPPPPQPQWSLAQQPQTWAQPQQQKQRNNVLIVSIIAVAAVLICGMLLFVFISSRDKDDNISESVSTERLADSTNTDMSMSTATAVGSNIDEHQYDWLSERAVTAADLSGKTPGDLRLMRNAIFARHGYIFKSADLQEYFRNFSWYTPQYADVTSRLSKLEKQNIDFIKKFEDGGSTASSSGKKSSGKLKNIGFTRDYSDYVCYSWLDDSDVAGLSSAELRILRNTIYARHGRKFKSADLRNYFNGFSWYSARYDEIPESWLSETEKHNIMLIKRYE